MTNESPAPSFFGLGIAPRLLEIIDEHAFRVPTPIQVRAIPIAIEGKDVIGVAQTGTGKTLAFGIPMIQRLPIVRGQGLVLLPTRELALQVDETLRDLGKSIGLRTAVIIGGAPMNRQIQSIRNRPHVIIATPGRLNDHLQQGTINLHQVKILVLDEADRMLDMGFAPQINKIIAKLSHERQTMLFSATMAAGIVTLANKLMRLPLQVEVAPSGTTAENVEHEVYIVSKDQKARLLEQVLKQYRGTVLVFTRTKHLAKRLTRAVRTLGERAAELHSDRSLNQRREALDGFKGGTYRILIATDIAARGIDVSNIELVVNYDLPAQPEDYVHRIGRTARAGRRGKAVSFVQPDQQRDLRDIERLIRIRIPVAKLPGFSHQPSTSQPWSPPGQAGSPAGQNRSARRPWQQPRRSRRGGSRYRH